MKLSAHVFEDKDSLVNVTTKVRLPKDASTEILQHHFFLAGQEQEAVDSVLFGSEENDFLALLMNMTWRCNLRCTHCFVLDKLVKEDTSKLNVPDFIDFVDRYKKRFPKVHTISVHFVGGEVSLISDECLQVINALKATFPETTFTFSTTINGTILDDSTIELIRQCDRINVSLDGNREANNAQRKSLDGFDPYMKTVENLKKLITLGFRDKVSVQASMTEKHMRDRQALVEFYKEMLMIGIHKGKIGVGGVVPVRGSRQDRIFQHYFKTQFFTRPCCKYRCGRLFQVDCSNKVYADYFEDTKQSCLGDLTSSIDEIVQRHREVVRQQMPVLSDPKCQTCPVIGVCWGRCCNFKQAKPSELCDQQFLVEKIHRYAEEGILMQRLRLAEGSHQITIQEK